MESILEENYYNPRSIGSYGGIERLKKKSKLKNKRVKKWLDSQDTYTLHKPIRRNFTRRRVLVGGINQQFQGDLVDMQRLKSSNNNISFLLTLIDVFSKYAYVFPLKNKKGESVAQCLKKLFKSTPPMLQLQTDRGVEFKNRDVQLTLKKYGVEFFVTHNDDIKASVIERFNRTLKERIFRYLTRKNTYKYIDVLNDIVESYNNSYHRSIKRPPSTVNYKNQEEVWKTLYLKEKKVREESLREGDRVRISKVKKLFEKGYLPNWTIELFTISRVLHQTHPKTYILKDDNGEELSGSFYYPELQKVGDKEIYQISNILKHRKKNGKNEILVEWLGYPSSFNSWIPNNNLELYNS